MARKLQTVQIWTIVSIENNYIGVPIVKFDREMAYHRFNRMIGRKIKKECEVRNIELPEDIITSDIPSYALESEFDFVERNLNLENDELWTVKEDNGDTFKVEIYTMEVFKSTLREALKKKPSEKAS